MKLRPVLALSLWLVAGTVLPASAQPLLRQGRAEHPCDSPADAVESGKPEGHTILVTVKRVDHRQGRLEFLTKGGAFVVTMTPTEMPDLRAGDHLVICLTGDMSDGEDRGAEDEPAATLRTRNALTLQPDTTPEHRTPLEAERGQTHR